MKRLLFYFAAVAVMVSCGRDPDPEPEPIGVIMEKLATAPVELMDRGDMPDWLVAKVDEIEEMALSFFEANICKGEWNGDAVYHIRHSFQSCVVCEFYHGNGDKVVFTDDGEREDLFLTSTKWVMIYDLKIGFSTRSVADDQYIFPIKSGTAEWNKFETIQARIDALQIPDSVLTTISTSGLLQTCLNFPYIIDIFFYNDYQQGFEALSAEFNGFRELMKRRDLPSVLLDKYGEINKQVSQKSLRSDIEKGMFSFRHFVLEFIMAQDVVIGNLSEEQEKRLFTMSLEQTKIEQDNPDIFSGLNLLPTSLMYAKKLGTETRFVQSPVSIDRLMTRSLENDIMAKYSIR